MHHVSDLSLSLSLSFSLCLFLSLSLSIPRDQVIFRFGTPQGFGAFSFDTLPILRTNNLYDHVCLRHTSKELENDSDRTNRRRAARARPAAPASARGARRGAPPLPADPSPKGRGDAPDRVLHGPPEPRARGASRRPAARPVLTQRPKCSCRPGPFEAKHLWGIPFMFRIIARHESDIDLIQSPQSQDLGTRIGRRKVSKARLREISRSLLFTCLRPSNIIQNYSPFHSNPLCFLDIIILAVMPQPHLGFGTRAGARVGSEGAFCISLRLSQH